MERVVLYFDTGARVEVVNGDGTLATPSDGDVLLYDPPWDIDIEMDCAGFDSVIAFSDGKNLGRCFSQVGRDDYRWLFVWDCVSSWYTKNRPLKRHKSAAWFGSSPVFSDGGIRRDSTTITPAKKTSNQRGEYVREARAGSMISDRACCPCRPVGLFDDIHVDPITKLHTTDQCMNHGKPIAWVQYLLAGIVSGCQSCVDPFGGTGAFAVACQSVGISCVTYEIDRSRFEAIVETLISLGGTIGA